MEPEVFTESPTDVGEGLPDEYAVLLRLGGTDSQMDVGLTPASAYRLRDALDRALSDVPRFPGDQRESELRTARAEMRVAEARAQQARARIDRTLGLDDE